jgi:hypothetical protein
MNNRFPGTDLFCRQVARIQERIPFSCHILSLSFLLLLFITSCNPQKKLIKAPIKEEGAEWLMQKLRENELKYQSFSAKFSAEYTNNGKKNSFDGQIRIEKDSIIWLTFSPLLGIEVFRIMITQDSVKYINRMNDTYFLGDYASVNKFLNTNIDFDILQSFLTGNDLSFYEKGKFRASVDKNKYKLATAARMKLKKVVRSGEETSNVLIQNIWIDPENFKITKADVKEIRKPGTQLQADYSNFEKLEGQMFPKMMTFDISADNDLHLEVTFSRININPPLTFPFRIPKDYRRVE